MDQLDYEYHHAQYAQLVGVGDAESKRYVEQKAQQVHIYHVHDALRDEQMKNLLLLPKLKEPRAVYFARFGVGRRVAMLWSAFRSVLEIVTVGRDKPLSSDDVKTVSRDLNTIYINIVGTIDNYAWCLVHERGSAAVKVLPPKRIGLFARDLISDACFSTLRISLEPYATWFADLRSRRDPAAHRIPLSVPPAILRPDEAKRYREIDTEIGQAIPRHEFERVDQLWLEQEKLGTFVPRFLHDPEEEFIPFYPTIPQDLAQLVRVSHVVREFLSV